MDNIEGYNSFYQEFQGKLKEQKLQKLQKLQEKAMEENVEGIGVEEDLDKTNESLNTGKPVQNIPPELWEKAARDFSEGNENLRQLILYCLQNNINTIGCCPGATAESRKDMPYLMFEFSENNKDAILKTIDQFSNEQGVEMSFTSQTDVIPQNFHIEFSPEIANESFSRLLAAFQTREKVDIEKIPPQMKSIIEVMKSQGELYTLTTAEVLENAYAKGIIEYDKSFFKVKYQTTRFGESYSITSRHLSDDGQKLERHNLFGEESIEALEKIEAKTKIANNRSDADLDTQKLGKETLAEQGDTTEKSTTLQDMEREMKIVDKEQGSVHRED